MPEGKFKALKAGEVEEGKTREVGEATFEVGKDVEMQGLLFTVTGIDSDPENRISLKGKA